jgi:hypothetical protein
MPWAIVGTGTPEEIAATPAFHTGRYLAPSSTSLHHHRDRPCYPRSNRTTKYGVCFLKSGNIVPQRILSIA